MGEEEWKYKLKEKMLLCEIYDFQRACLCILLKWVVMNFNGHISASDKIVLLLQNAGSYILHNYLHLGENFYMPI